MDRIGSNTPIYSKKACVVYDARTGRLHHVHRVVTFVGGREPSEEQMTRDALHAFKGPPMGHSGEFHTLQVRHDAIEPGKSYRIDHHKRALVAKD
jgi:hypothetical protein